MANNKVKVAIFGTVVAVSVLVIIGLVVHRSIYRDRICKNRYNLYYEDPDTEGLTSTTTEGKCLPAGMQGPCGNYMVISLDTRNITNVSKGVGVCECDVEHFARPMVYHEETKQCYFVFTQAYCEEGMWLTIKKNEGPVCDTRICDEPDGSGRELVPLRDGRCVELNKYDNVTCNKSEVIQFYRKKYYPTCSKPLGISTGSVGNVPPTDCPAGYFSTGVGHCQPDFDFD